jgi:hypothetical protein
VLLQGIRLGQAWSPDFISDVLYDGRVFRTFDVIDACNREVLRIKLVYY